MIISLFLTTKLSRFSSKVRLKLMSLLKKFNVDFFTIFTEESWNFDDVSEGRVTTKGTRENSLWVVMVPET